jgi:PTH1 family peptidyl-tRNA hydrolase
MKLIVGLGNPGMQYTDTRHNIGFKIADQLVENSSEHSKVSVPELLGELTKVNSIYLVLKPTGYMNNSGQEVQKVVRFFKIPLEDILIVHDEVDLPFADIRLERNRSSAGHRGVESVIESLGSQEFYRLRFGVGRSDSGIPTDKFVLENFAANEQADLDKLTSQALENITNWLG